MLPLFSWYVFGCPKQGGETAIGQKSLPKRSFSAICSYSPLLSRLVLSATKTVFPPFLDERSRNKGTVKCQKQPKYGSQSGPSPIYIYIYNYTHIHTHAHIHARTHTHTISQASLTTDCRQPPPEFTKLTCCILVSPMKRQCTDI